MASVATIARVSAILLLCLALRGCDGKFPFNAAEALAKARAAAVGNVGPDVKHFNVLDYGAKADGKTDSSINFIRAFKAACNYNGNAMMVIPDGNFLIGPVIFSGPCFNPSPLIIQANGMVKAQSDISYYAGGADDTDWITFQSIDGLILTGHGTFHGQGAEVWKYNNCGKKSNCVRLPAFTTLDIIKQSLKSYCLSIFVNSIGSLGHYDAEADVKGIVVKNCSLTDTDNGLRIKTYKNSSPSKASSIIFRDIVMTRVKNPIIIDQEYGNRRSNEPSKVSISDVFYTNIRGTTISKVAVDLTCSLSNPCQGIHLNNVNLQYAGLPNDNLPFSSNCVNAKVAYVGAQSPLPCH
ncbi:hypothetical protein QUC31_016194 [Theobroma cacao]